MSKVMIVEDDNNLRAIYGDRLLAEGYEVVSASDGEEALAIAVKERPDLIISDVMMPKISGFDMLDILRSTPETKETKVIMMTALSQTEDKERADKLGADKYLVKSQVTLDDVARVVNEVIAGPGVAAHATAPAPTAPATAPEPFAPTPMPAMPAPDPVAMATPPPAPAATMAEPVTPITPAEPAAPPIQQAMPAADPLPTPPPVAPPAPVDDSVIAAVADTAEPEEEEKAEISAEIDNFIATNTDAPAAAPVTDTSAQEHAMNALQPALVEPAEAAPTPAAESAPEPTVATPPPVNTPEVETADASEPVTENVEMKAPSESKKVIEPLPAQENKPSIYDLYEKEMAAEAAQVNAATPAPQAGGFIETPVADTPIPTPVATQEQSPSTPEAPSVTPVQMPVAQPPAEDGGHVPHPDDPASIAL